MLLFLQKCGCGGRREMMILLLGVGGGAEKAGGYDFHRLFQRGHFAFFRRCPNAPGKDSG